ncbi:MAG: hypothetical protein NXI32_08200 [bacterium]|nr:hypothetical protein [bacterium]
MVKLKRRLPLLAALLASVGCLNASSGPVQQCEASSNVQVTETETETDSEEFSPGLAVGAKAPSISLKDQNGVERKLSDLLSKGPVALVFYRSADW